MQRSHWWFVSLGLMVAVSATITLAYSGSDGYVQDSEVPITLESITGSYGSEDGKDENASDLKVSGVLGFHVGVGTCDDDKEGEGTTTHLLRLKITWEGEVPDDPEPFTVKVKSDTGLEDRVGSQHTVDWSSPSGPPEWTVKCKIEIAESKTGQAGGWAGEKKNLDWTAIGHSPTVHAVDQDYNSAMGAPWVSGGTEQNEWNWVINLAEGQEATRSTWVSATAKVTFSATAKEIQAMAENYVRAKAYLHAQVVE